MPNHFQECSLSLDGPLPSHIQLSNYFAADVGLGMIYSRLMPGQNSIHEYTLYFQFKRENKQTNNTYYTDVTILFSFSKILKTLCSSSGLYINRWQRQMNQPMSQNRSVTKLDRKLDILIPRPKISSSRWEQTDSQPQLWYVFALPLHECKFTRRQQNFFSVSEDVFLCSTQRTN